MYAFCRFTFLAEIAASMLFMNLWESSFGSEQICHSNTCTTAKVQGQQPCTPF